MTTKVSVVIAVWNPGKYFDRCVDSLLAQTMPASDFEVLFMDDGSTDGTERRLDELAQQHPHFTVHHLENSGWPGKPRNLGIRAAVGDYIQFMDNDDALGPEALERMYSIGARNDSDIVIGKVTSNFRGVPHQVFRETRERCTVRDAPLFESLTPHKMFRRQFLLDNDIRYPEGKRRLEDQLIMARAYFPAKNVSIVGDCVCYYYLKRDDGKNAGSTRIEPHGYYQNLREVLAVVEANTEPGEFRDSIQRRFYRGEMLSRLSGTAVLKYQAQFREELFAEVRALALEPRFAPTVHSGLPAFIRVRSHLLREDRLDDLLSLSERVNEIKAKARLESLRWQDGVLVLGVRGWFGYRDGDLELIRQDGRMFVPPEIALDAPPEQRDCTGQLAEARVDVTIKNRDTGVEFFVPAKLRLVEVPGARIGDAIGIRPEWHGEARIDPLTALGGQRLPRGVWDVSMRLNALGVSRDIRLGRSRAKAVDAAVRPALVGAAGVLTIPYWTEPYSNLSVDIDEFAKSLKDAVRPTATARVGRADGGATVIATLPLVVHPARPIEGELRLIDRATGVGVDCAVESQVSADTLELTSPLPKRGTAGLSAGTWDLALTSPALGWAKPVRFGPVLSVGARGRLRGGKSPEARAVSPEDKLTRGELLKLVLRARQEGFTAAMARRRVSK